MRITVATIQTNDDLRRFCDQISAAQPIAIDTEFVRERTYYPQLCLVQVRSGSNLGLLDTLALTDLDALYKVLRDTTIAKLIHAARQDLEALYQASGQVPAPVFDTQVAAELCGLGEQAGLAAVTSTLLGIEVDKSHARADWGRRPLPAAWLEYAANDVRHLPEIAEKLEQKLRSLGRLQWLEQDCARLSDPGLYATAPADAWRRVKGIRRLDHAAFHVARALANWRETRAMEKNRPRAWILRDETLLLLADQQPVTAQALAATPTMPAAVVRNCADELIRLIATARECREPAPALQAPLTQQQKNTINRMMKVVREQARQLDIAPTTLATRRDLTRIVRGKLDTIALQGWREEVIGTQLLEISAND